MPTSGNKDSYSRMQKVIDLQQNIINDLTGQIELLQERIDLLKGRIDLLEKINTMKSIQLNHCCNKQYVINSN